MPPRLAAFLTWAFVFYLFRRDVRQRPNVTGALWIPLLWMLIICTRTFTQWLSIFGIQIGGVSVEEGSPVDAAVYYALIGAGIYVLMNRQVRLGEFIRNNGWLTAFLIFGLLAIAWSDFPFVALKRWTKVIGHPIMALILFSEPDFEEALKTLMKRCAYIVVPVSIMLIKYYPLIGRNAGPWATAQMNNGIALGKNLLGADCMILGLFFFWNWLQVWRTEKGVARRNELVLTMAFLIAILWLLHMAQSSTATLTLTVSALTLVLLGRRFVDKRLIGGYVVAFAVIYYILEVTFGISSLLIEALGRDSTLTGRRVLWDQVWDFRGDPIIGVGFESFWLGERLRKIGELYWWQANEAHNGYLETFLNLGAIGVVLMIGCIVAAFRKSRLESLTNFEYGRFRLSFIAATVIYNWTESGFRSLHPMWFVFFIIAVNYPRLEYEPVAQPWEISNAEELEFAPTREEA